MSLYPFLNGLKELLELSDTPVPDDILLHYRTSQGCWNNFEVQFPPDKREHVYALPTGLGESVSTIVTILLTPPRTITVEPFIEQPNDGDCIHWGRLSGFSMNRPESLWAVGDTKRTPIGLAFSLWQAPIRCISTLFFRREAVRSPEASATSTISKIHV